MFPTSHDSLLFLDIDFTHQGFRVFDSDLHVPPFGLGDQKFRFWTMCFKFLGLCFGFGQRSGRPQEKSLWSGSYFPFSDICFQLRVRVLMLPICISRLISKLYPWTPWNPVVLFSILPIISIWNLKRVHQPDIQCEKASSELYWTRERLKGTIWIQSLIFKLYPWTPGIQSHFSLCCLKYLFEIWGEASHDSCPGCPIVQSNNTFIRPRIQSPFFLMVIMFIWKLWWGQSHFSLILFNISIWNHGTSKCII